MAKYAICAATGKRGYDRSAAAHTALHRFAGAKPRNLGTLEVYLCHFCHRFHLGNRTERVAQEISE